MIVKNVQSIARIRLHVALACVFDHTHSNDATEGTVERHVRQKGCELR